MDDHSCELVNYLRIFLSLFFFAILLYFHSIISSFLFMVLLPILTILFSLNLWNPEKKKNSQKMQQGAQRDTQKYVDWKGSLIHSLYSSSRSSFQKIIAIHWHNWVSSKWVKHKYFYCFVLYKQKQLSKVHSAKF